MQEGAPSLVYPPPVQPCSQAHRGHKSQGERGLRGHKCPTLLLLLPTKGRSLPYPTAKNVFPSPGSLLVSLSCLISRSQGKDVCAGLAIRKLVNTRNNLSLSGLKNEGVGPTDSSARLYLPVLWQGFMRGPTLPCVYLHQAFVLVC